MTRRRNGFALMAALWLVVLVGVTGYELSVRSRARRLAVANALESVHATAAAEAALETADAALAVLLKRQTPDPWDDLRAFRPDTLQLGDERATVSVIDAGARLQINRASEDDIRRLLVALPLDAGDADRISQHILDWRDADDLRRGRGAEREEYLKAGARVLPANGDFIALEDLKNVDGVTSDLYARVAPYLSIHGTGQINVNSAPQVVLRSLPGLTQEAIAVLLATRQSNKPLRSIEELALRVSSGSREALNDAGLAGRIVFDSRSVVVETMGWLQGSPVRAHGASLIERSGDAMNVAWRRVSR